MPPSKTRSRRNLSSAARLGTALLAYAAAFSGSLLAGTPAELPVVALGWGLLLHVERATALTAGIGVVLLVAWRASRGDYPIRFGQVEYAVRRAAEDIEAQERAIENRLKALEVLVIRNHPDERQT